MEQNDIFNANNFISDDPSALIKVVGVGGGGGNAVNYMYNQNIPNIKYVVCNTDKQALERSPVPDKLVLGYSITKGLGAGNIPEVGKQCAEASEEDIRKLFSDGTEMVFVTAGMGGGTGTGAAPVVARIAKECGMLTIGIVTVPFMFEGERKILKAIEGAEEMKKHVDALLVINNENIIELYKDWNFFNAFGKADDTLANAARSISEIISENCYINVDFQDVKTILRDSGTAIISTAYGEGEHRISDAIHNAIHSPLLKSHDIKTSKRLLLKFSVSSSDPEAIQAQEINEITEFTSALPASVDVKWGIADNPELGSKVKITLLASGFDVSIREGDKIEGTTIDFENELHNPGEGKTERTPNERDVLVAQVYGQEKVTEQRQKTAKLRYTVLTPEQFDDHEVIALIESTPALQRDARFNQMLESLRTGRTAAPAQTEKPDTRPADGGAAPIMFG